MGKTVRANADANAESTTGTGRKIEQQTMSELNEKPILFSGEMVRAILDGRKTQTRRIAKPRFDDRIPCEHWKGDGDIMFRHCSHGSEGMPCPYGVAGDRLWVKETFCPSFSNDDESVNGYCYRATHNGPDPLRWKPSILMPREASRNMLEITGIRVQRVQEITEEDAKAEGVEPLPHVEGLYAGWKGDAFKGKLNYRDGFRFIWEKINGQKAWDENPWVWVIEFWRIG